MKIFESIVLGLVQGLTEFIPVSSSGHLELAQRLLASGDRAADFHIFLEVINFGTLLALLIHYRKKIWAILKDIFVKHDWHMAINLILTSVPAGIIGVLFSDVIEGAPFFSALITIAIAMGAVGIIMIFIDYLPHLSKIKDEQHLPHLRAFMIGLIQSIALIPGVSRSGSTIIGGRLMGMDSESSADYSFLASIPIMLGVCGKTLIDSDSIAYIGANWQTVLLSNAVAFVSGMIALKFMLKFLRKPHALETFGYYRVVLASVVLVLIIAGIA